MIPDWETGSVFQAMRQEPVGVQQRKGGEQQPLSYGKQQTITATPKGNYN
jgi:hypothetical protein